MVFLERYTLLWHLGFTYSTYFFDCLQLGLFGTRSANTKSAYAGYAVVRSIYVKNV